MQTIPVNSIPSYYFLTAEINCNKKRKLKIIKLLKQNNIGFNEKHRELVHEWKWINKYTIRKFKSVNALNYRKKQLIYTLMKKYSKKT